MNSKHTPGPWHVAANPHPKATHPLAPEFVSNTHRYVATSPDIEDEFGEPCAEIVAQTFDGPNQSGNATLISAAPELLDALERLEAGVRLWMSRGVTDEDMEIARAAIRKARGEA